MVRLRKTGNLQRWFKIKANCWTKGSFADTLLEMELLQRALNVALRLAVEHGLHYKLGMHRVSVLVLGFRFIIVNAIWGVNREYISKVVVRMVHRTKDNTCFVWDVFTQPQDLFKVLLILRHRAVEKKIQKAVLSVYSTCMTSQGSQLFNGTLIAQKWSLPALRSTGHDLFCSQPALYCTSTNHCANLASNPWDGFIQCSQFIVKIQCWD